MAERIDKNNTVLGRVKYFTLGGVIYNVTADGVTIQQFTKQEIKPVVGHIEPRITAHPLYYRIDLTVGENTVWNLAALWNQPNAIASFPNFDTLYLGNYSTVPVYTLVIYQYGNTLGKERRWTFNKIVSFEHKPLSISPSTLSNIQVSFYGYGDSAQPSGQEFGRIDQDR